LYFRQGDKEATVDLGNHIVGWQAELGRGEKGRQNRIVKYHLLSFEDKFSVFPPNLIKRNDAIRCRSLVQINEFLHGGLIAFSVIASA
jgi:hypothetical protein